MMAASDPPRKLTGSDRVTDAILSHVSHHVVPRVRKQFATGPLGLSDSQHDNIEDDEKYSERKNFEILRAWRNKSSGLTIKTLVDNLSEWQERGYINPDVWRDMETLVSPDLLPAASAANEAAPGTSSAPSGARDSTSLPSSDRDRTATTSASVGERNVFKDFKTLLKSQLRRRFQYALRNDWLPDGKAKTFPLKECYTNLGWKKKVKKAMRDTSYELKRIHDVFDNEFEDGAINVALIGPAGIGKTSTLSMLALEWANDAQDSGLGQFEFVFVIKLSKVNDNSSLEQIVIKQHGLKVPESQVRSILDGESGGKVLLMFDGYDEYQKGTNDDIDAAIENTIGNCFLILTSRDGDYISKETLDTFDGEIEITGLSEENIEKCAAAYLENKEKARTLIREAYGLQIYELLRIPIILLMVCVLYFKKGKLPKSQTAISSDIVGMCMDRSAIKHFGKKAKEMPGIDDMLYRLGELSWRTLKSKTRQLLLPKDEVQKISEDLLRLGILQEATGDEEVSLGEEPDWVMFPHKLFQEYWAAYYASRPLTNAESQDEIDKVFSIVEDMDYHWNVLKFTCGLLDDSSLLIERICANVVELVIQRNETRLAVTLAHLPSINEYIRQLRYLEDLNLEKSAKSCSPFFNSEICCVNEKHSVLNKNSTLYFFQEDSEYSCENQGISSSSPGSVSTKPCGIIINAKDSQVRTSSLETCSRIDQPVRYLEISGPTMNEHTTAAPHTRQGRKADDRLLFHDGAVVKFSDVDFENLCWIVDSLKVATNVNTVTFGLVVH